VGVTLSCLAGWILAVPVVYGLHHKDTKSQRLTKDHS